MSKYWTKRFVRRTLWQRASKIASRTRERRRWCGFRSPFRDGTRDKPQRERRSRCLWCEVGGRTGRDGRSRRAGHLGMLHPWMLHPIGNCRPWGRLVGRVVRPLWVWLGEGRSGRQGCRRCVLRIVRGCLQRLRRGALLNQPGRGPWGCRNRRRGLLWDVLVLCLVRELVVAVLGRWRRLHVGLNIGCQQGWSVGNWTRSFVGRRPSLSRWHW